ncbi:methyl-accepting chemotaxis protein [hydrocarbon metagenome]|uniref:Methyl-accepting chemotaxis protein n=1 Tax=hydrocarbon metagenome TaxID=938273 RepID=A0A0W8G878_9ZZZZ
MVRSLTLTAKIILGGIVLALASTAIMGGINQWRVIPALTEMGETFLSTVSADVMSAVRMQDAITQEKVNADLELLFMEMARFGQVEEDRTRPVSMEIVNQATGSREKTHVPKLTAGYQDITGNFEIVDRMQKMVGGTATIFQVLPGKMVRVSTNVRRPDGERAVGTYLDASSPVYQACLRGETYRGRALVVGDWYVTSYKPIMDADGKVLAVVYVGRPIMSPQLRDALEATRVAGKGFAFVYNSAGDILQGNDPGLQGANLTEHPFGQRLLDQKDGLVEYVSGGVPKKALVRYFEPWDWHVAVGVDVADLDQGMGPRLTQAAFLSAGVAVAVGIVLALVASGYVTRPLRRAEEAARRIAGGDHSLRLAEGRDEVGRLSAAFNAILDANGEAARVNANYVNMLNAVSDPIFAVDGDMRIIAANARAAALAGKPQAELAGMACRDAFPAALCDAARCSADENAHGTESGVVEITLGGASRFVKPVSGIMRDTSGETVGYVEVARDVTAMVRAERAMAENLEHTRQVNEEINAAGRRIAAALEGISGQVDEVRQGSERQSRRVGETATAMGQMNAAVLEVAKNAAEAAHNATSARTKAEEGARVVQKAVASIAAVEQQVLSLRDKMEGLGEKAQGIGRIIGVISDIADQTNLLALNAAIEAARAGEAGRGFAVVADEVRKLAEKTMTATKEVETAVADIQRGAAENMEATQDAAREISESTRMAQQSGGYLTDIVELVTATADQVRSIAASAEEQSAASEHVSAAMDEVSRISAETAEGMVESADAVGELADLAGKLRMLAE